MTQVQLHRPARVAPPPVAGDEVTLPAPPRRTAGSGPSPWLRLGVPVLGAGGGLVYVLMRPSLTSLLVAGLALVGSVAMALVTTLQQWGGANRRRRRDQGRYLDHLDVLRDQLEGTARAQDRAGRWCHPPIEGVWTITLDRRRVWERRPRDPDFGEVRVGTGAVPLASRVRREDPNDVLAEFDPVCEEAARQLLDDARELPGQPLTVPLAKSPVLSVIGDPESRRSLTRGLLCQLTAFHAPEDWHLALCVSKEVAPHWDWAKWLPHLQLEQEAGDVTRLVATDPRALAALLHDELERRAQLPEPIPGPTTTARPGRVLIVFDGYLPADVFERAPALRDLLAREDLLGFGMVFLVDSSQVEPSRVDARAEIEPDGGLRLEAPAGPDGIERIGDPDLVPGETAEAVARALAPLRDRPRVERMGGADPVGLPGLLGISVPDGVGPGSSWREGIDGDLLKVPIGVREDGTALHLDLKEAAHGGMGPHGLVVGATGSGKSELLRTLITALAATHPPELVSLVLVDFKGGATFAGLADLPHVAGLITNLQGEVALVDRVYQALFGELNRRQELLRAAGNLASVHEYQERRQAGASLDPLPNLLIVVDEFGELLTSRPEFIDLFVAIGRLGRSLGMHLLLATQRLEEGRLRGLESHLSYRICLRTFSPLESRAVIEVPDAYYLPPLPGSGYLKVDTTVFDRFRCALVSTAPGEPRAAQCESPALMAFDLAGDHPLEGSQPAVPQPSTPEGPPPATTMRLIVDRLSGAAPRVHQIWLPPLPARIPLGSVLSRPVHEGPWKSGLRVPIGIADRPQEQRQEALVFDFSGGLGHLVVVGAPRTGKSGLLRTIVTGLALTHTPREVQVYGIDYGGGGLHRLDVAPHVGTIARRTDPERVRRVVNEVWSLMAAREEEFSRAGVESMDDYRRRRHESPEDAFGDVFLLIDDWPAFRLEHQDLEAAVIDIAGRGLGYGIHLVITAQRWIDVRSSLRESLGTRLELRLNDPIESEIDRRASTNLAAAPPGRGIALSGVQFQALFAEGPAGGWRLDDLLRELAGDWPGPKAPPVRILPTVLELDDLARMADPNRGVPVGVGEDDLAPVYLDVSGADPHFLVFGDGESGKTNFLRLWMAGLCRRTPPAGCQVLVVDYRRTLLEAVPADHLLSYAGTAAAAADAITALRAVLAERLPPATLSARQLRDRSWWSGPDIHVVVDDYDLVASPAGNPLQPLLDLLPQGHDLGLHVILARRAAGAGRASFEPLLGRLKELGTPGLLLSGDPDEGPLLGACRPRSMPAGRGVLVRRRATPMTIQTALLPARELEEVASA